MGLSIPDTLLAASIPLLVLLYLYVAPYTKVEESFNIQAVHDHLRNHIAFRQIQSFLRENYDHLTFTGPVPRTFVGSVVLATLSWPGSLLVQGVDLQIWGVSPFSIPMCWRRLGISWKKEC